MRLVRWPPGSPDSRARGRGHSVLHHGIADPRKERVHARYELSLLPRERGSLKRQGFNESHDGSRCTSSHSDIPSGLVAAEDHKLFPEKEAIRVIAWTSRHDDVVRGCPGGQPSTLARSRPPTLGRSDPGQEQLLEGGSGTGLGPEGEYRPILTRSGPLVSDQAERPAVRRAGTPAGGDVVPLATSQISPGVRAGMGRRCGWWCTDGAGG